MRITFASYDPKGSEDMTCNFLASVTIKSPFLYLAFLPIFFMLSCDSEEPQLRYLICHTLPSYKSQIGKQSS